MPLRNFTTYMCCQLHHTPVVLVGSQGFEPRMPEASDLQSDAVANAARYPLSGPGVLSLDRAGPHLRLRHIGRCAVAA